MKDHPRFAVQEVKNIGRVILGNIFLGFAYANWMKPNGIINGGVTSVAMILEKVTALPILYWTLAVTFLLLLFCWFFLGKGNFFKSILSSVCYNVFFALFLLIPIHFQVNLLFDFLAASLFIAIGYYLCIAADASTVGMDVIALALHKRNPQFNVAKGIRRINYLVLGVGLVVYGLQAVLLGVAFSFLNSFLLGQFLRKKAVFTKEV